MPAAEIALGHRVTQARLVYHSARSPSTKALSESRSSTVGGRSFEMRDGRLVRSLRGAGNGCGAANSLSERPVIVLKFRKRRADLLGRGGQAITSLARAKAGPLDQTGPGGDKIAT
ncbi:MAG: hypothetical protein U0556_17480 [Dehalococcoidia bacterium]